MDVVLGGWSGMCRDGVREIKVFLTLKIRHGRIRSVFGEEQSS